jgi:hypothetical protein
VNFAFFHVFQPGDYIRSRSTTSTKPGKTCFNPPTLSPQCLLRSSVVVVMMGIWRVKVVVVMGRRNLLLLLLERLPPRLGKRAHMQQRRKLLGRM